MPYDHLVRVIRRRVAATPHAVALRHEVEGRWEPITYRELETLMDATASWLISHGVDRGDRVVIYAPNSPWWTIADLGALAIGAVTVPAYATSTQSAVEHVVRDSGAHVVFVEGPDRFAALEGLRRDGAVRDVIVFDADGAPSAPGVHAAKDVFAHAVVPELADRGAALAPADVATIVYTSGTTGEPKGVVLTHTNVLTQFDALDRHFDVGPRDRSLCFLPLSHMYERAWTAYVLTKGAENYYLADPKRVSEVMPVVRPTCMVSVPRLFEKVSATARHRASGSPLRARLLEWALRVGEQYHEARLAGRQPAIVTRLGHAVADRLVLQRIRDAVGGPKSVFSAGGAALSAEVERFFFAAGLIVCQGYGLTETSPMLTCNRPRDFRFGSVGKPIDGCELRIAEDGEVLARGANIMQGYYGRPRETAEAFDGDWFRTGDLGEFDADGFLTLTGRKKELIITSGGRNVAPSLVESAIGRDYYVEQVAAIGDGRPFLSALVVPQFEALQEWARAQGIAFDSLRTLANDARVRAFMAARIDAQQAMLAAHERVKRFTLLPERFTQAGGEITPTLKNIRSTIVAKYADAIEAMYGQDPVGQSE